MSVCSQTDKCVDVNMYTFLLKDSVVCMNVSEHIIASRLDSARLRICVSYLSQ